MKAKKYRFASTVGFKAKHLSPDAAGNALEAIRSSGDITPKRVVDDARPEDHPLHPAFEWDDSVAAEEYRFNQARSLIRAVYVDNGPRRDATPAYYHVEVDRVASYQPASVVVGDVDMYESAKEQLVEKLRIAMRSLQQLEALAAMNRQPKRTAQVGKVKELLDAAIQATLG